MSGIAGSAASVAAVRAPEGVAPAMIAVRPAALAQCGG
jgi:hypothetical protein